MARGKQRSVARPKVAIIYRYIPQYRREFYTNLQCSLRKRNIEFDLYFGHPGPDASKADAITLGFAKPIRTVYLPFFGKNIVLQIPSIDILHNDMIIVEQANRLLVNYLLLLISVFAGPKVAFWGHGKNFQASAGDWFTELVKRRMICAPHWWFAYNQLVKTLLVESGFDIQRITDVNNAIDTTSLIEQYDSVGDDAIKEIKTELGFNARNTLIYCGGMYKEKHLPFLLSSLDLLKLVIPDVEMIFIGSGPQAQLVKEFCSQREWARFLGPKFGADRVKYFKLAKLQVMPGLVGLTVLDSFALRVPIVTTSDALHSPEICYLENNVNGVMVAAGGDPAVYAEAIADLLQTPARLEALRAGCTEAAKHYTVTNMVERFADGIERALGRR